MKHITYYDNLATPEQKATPKDVIVGKEIKSPDGLFRQFRAQCPLCGRRIPNIKTDKYYGKNLPNFCARCGQCLKYDTLLKELYNDPNYIRIFGAQAGRYNPENQIKPTDSKKERRKKEYRAKYGTRYGENE